MKEIFNFVNVSKSGSLVSHFQPIFLGTNASAIFSRTKLNNFKQFDIFQILNSKIFSNGNPGQLNTG